MEFRVETVYARSDFRGMVRAVKYRQNKNKPVRRVLGKIIYFAAWAVTLFYVVTVVLLFKDGNAAVGRSMILMGMLPLVMFVALLLLRNDWIISAFSWRNYREKGQQIAYRFCEKFFMTYTSVSDQRFYYKVIEEVMETRDCYYLFIAANAAHMLRKTSFTEGGAEEFREFISRVTGKPVVFVK